MYLTETAALSSTGPAAAGELAERTESVDALRRFGFGQDLHDADLSGSAFTVEAVLDFRPCASRLGVESDLMRGRDTIVSTIIRMFDGGVDRVIFGG